MKGIDIEMPFVVDTSVAACWAFDDEDHPVASQALERVRADRAYVPALWWFEVWNTMVSNERRGRLTPADTAVFLRTVSRLGIVTDREADGAVIIELARKHRLTAYDAAYLELAQRRAASLATLDDALVRAAKAESVPLVGE